MTSWHSYPKLYNVGHAALKELLDDPVVVEEKVDGSQFSFGVFDGVLKCRSKGKELDLNAPEKMFLEAVGAARNLAAQLKDGWTYRGEYLQKPKHNTLAYDRIPAAHIILFDINTGEEAYLNYEEKRAEAARLGLECVPLVFQGMLESFEQFESLLNTVSVLGGQKIEGLVIKNYAKFGPDKKALMGKFVSEAFKEIHSKDWKERNPNSRDMVDLLTDRYKTPARWNKAVQHLAERGELTNTPADIGKLIKEVQDDIRAECEAEIKQQLFDATWQRLSRSVVGGLPQWYKTELSKAQFEK